MLVNTRIALQVTTTICIRPWGLHDGDYKAQRLRDEYWPSNGYAAAVTVKSCGKGDYTDYGGFYTCYRL